MEQQKVKMIYDGDQPIPKVSVPTTSGSLKRPHRPAFEITDKTPKGQIPVIEGWNEMRQDCINHGIMEPN